MFIKNIIISGFRSYREQSFPEGLSSKTNVIVGKNGSGKSNFFTAVQFVLSEKFANLRAADRKELFHVGSGRAALSIYVEIVFDNKDGRLVIPGRATEPEVRIRRTVGLKQDEFRVNDRRFSADEVHKLLQSAGLSSSNPYYIVEQGKIVNLANMSEEDRYHVIKEVAGTKVYEARRSESEKILAETEGKQKQIDDSISQLEKRLRDLESETAELKEFQESDNEKKCIEYCIFSAELESAKGHLEKLEKEWSAQVAFLNENQDSEVVSEQEIVAHTQKISELSLSIARLESEKKVIEQEAAALNRKQAVMELDVNHAAGKLSRNERERALLSKELIELDASSAKTKQEAKEKRQRLATLEQKGQDKLMKATEQLHTLERMQEKRSRTKLYKTKAARDEWITQEIASNTKITTDTLEELRRLEEQIVVLDGKIEEEKSKRIDRETSTRNVEKTMTSHDIKIADVLKSRDQLNRERRQLWQVVHEKENVVQRLEEQHQRARLHLERSVRYDIRQGLQSLDEILSEAGNTAMKKRVFGPVIDLIQVEAGFETAVEITAGNTLFHIVVDSFDTSARLLSEMNKRKKPGRVSFFPMDTCNATRKTIPSTAECSPLMSKLAFDAKFNGVLSEVFGRTAVVATLDVAARYVKELQCDVVTLDGDQLARKGGITGGFIDKGNMKLPAYAKERELGVSVASERATLDGMCQKVAFVEQRITDVLNELETLRNQTVSEEKTVDANLREVRLLEERINRLTTERDSLISAKRTHEKAVANTKVLIKRLQLDVKEEFKTSWSAEDEVQLERLIMETAESKKAAATMQGEVVQLATEVQLLEDSAQHLERRVTIVKDRIRELGWSKRADQEMNTEKSAVLVEISSLTERLAKIEGAIDVATKEKQSAQTLVEKLSSKRFSTTLRLQERKDSVEKMELQRSLLLQRRDDATHKLRKLGVIPRGAEKYVGSSIGKLMFHLKRVNEDLKRFSHVNRKALDQHTVLLETKNDLVSQRSTLNQELMSINELIDHLDRKKDEAIERTYKQIQFQFEQVFKELAGAEDSIAELQLVRPAEGVAGEDPYMAVRIRVSFGVGNAISELEQLSGGQKSLVALALIFAIQRCDPAPFYLFDEIDAALDAEYRAAVANMIQKQSADCQFLVASFKTEMLSVADNIFGIFFRNKVSRIQRISMDEGIYLLKQAAAEGKRAREDDEAA